MFNRRCVRCGSTTFRADRSLGGRLVCSRCGIPADQLRAGSASQGGLRRPSQRGGGGFRFWLLLALVVLVLVVLFQSA